MISNSFIFLDKVGKNTEQKIWSQGITDWNRFLAKECLPGFSRPRKLFSDRIINDAKKALFDYDSAYFRNLLAPQEAWRLYSHFKDDAVYLDIETMGGYGNITVIGLYDGLDTKMMVRGANLEPGILAQELKNYKLIVTFNGSSFDLPVIQRYFGNHVIPDIPHIDLRGVCSRIGLRGGLKSIEKQIGIARPDDLTHVYGSDAAYLWQKYHATQNPKYLQVLIRYNEEDIINLKPLAEHAISRLWRETYSASSPDQY